MGKAIQGQYHLNEYETATALHMSMSQFRKLRLKGDLNFYPVPIGLSLYFNKNDVHKLKESLGIKDETNGKQMMKMKKPGLDAKWGYAS